MGVHTLTHKNPEVKYLKSLFESKNFVGMKMPAQSTKAIRVSTTTTKAQTSLLVLSVFPLITKSMEPLKKGKSAVQVFLFFLLTNF